MVRTPSQCATGTDASAAEIAEDQDRPPAQPVDPDPRGQREEQEGQELDRGQQRDLERALVQGENRDQRQGEEGHLRAELADRLRHPQRKEVALPPETAGPPRFRRPG